MIFMRRHRFFLKIYLWFLLATVVGIMTQIAIDRILHTGPGGMPHRMRMDQALNMYGLAAADIYERGSAASLNDFLENIERTTEFRVFLFSADGTELTGRALPPEFENIGSLVERNGENGPRPQFGENGVISRNFTSGTGQAYIIAQMMPRPFQPRKPPGPPGLLRVLGPFGRPSRLAIVLILTGGFCYALARNITGPIIKLDSAVRQFAGGNLSVRVSPSIGKGKDEIADLANSFDHMASRIESLVVSQKTLLRDISHELRSPLARLYVALELSRRGRTPEEEASLDRIEREADRLKNLIDQILSLNVVESGMSAIEKKPVDLAGMIRAVADDADFEANSINREVKIVACDACMVTGSEELLRRAVENVVRNAVRYTAEHTAVEITLTRVAAGSSNRARVIVRDHGPGVSEVYLNSIFKPFYRIGEDRDRQSGGTGIGLAITDTAVRLHEGSVQARNAPDGGLIVEMSFPAS